MVRFYLAILVCLFMVFQESVQEQQVSDFYQIAWPYTENSYNFDTTRNKRQVQGILKTIQAFDNLACIHECGRDPLSCIAVNFKKHSDINELKNCELLEFEGRKDDEMAFENNNDYDFIVIKNPQFQDCSEIKKYKKVTISKTYPLRPSHFRSFVVRCDFDTNGEGWTIIQRRINGSVDFYRTWDDYKNGFGVKKANYWLGLDNIHALTSRRKCRLRVDLEDFSGNKRYAEYDTFYVAGEEDNYRLTIGGYSGNAGDSLSFHNNHQFSTKDRDNDASPDGECAKMYHGGWWYASCHYSNLNGKYLNGVYSQYALGVVWSKWLGFQYSLKTSVIKILPSK